jgi:hypothetical protein
MSLVVYQRTNVLGLYGQIQLLHIRRWLEKVHVPWAFCETLDDFHALPNSIENAKRAIAIRSFGQASWKDLLHIEIHEPNCPHLTIVDLPGLIHSETK